MCRILLVAICCIGPFCVQAQKDSSGAAVVNEEDIDALFSDLETLLDSITQPKSFGSVSLMAGNRMLNVQSQSGQALTRQSLLLSPAAGYYHKSGFGLGGSVALLSREGQLRPSQYLATFSYDLLRIPGVLSGVAYNRFFRPDSLNYYTSPLKNELSAYAMYRKSWIKPAVSVAYGWGTKSSVQEQSALLEALKRKKKKGRGNGSGNDVIPEPITTVTNTSESVSDWMISFSARHDFYFFNVLTSHDNFRFTPQLSFNGGTQRYGFNQSTNTYLVKRSDSFNKPFMSDQVSLQDATKFQPVSATAFLRTAYSKGKFFFQPQVIFDYYIPAPDHNLTTSFAVNSGIIF